MTTDPIKVSDVHVRVEFTAEAVHSLPGPPHTWSLPHRSGLLYHESRRTGFKAHRHHFPSGQFP